MLIRTVDDAIFGAAVRELRKHGRIHAETGKERCKVKMKYRKG